MKLLLSSLFAYLAALVQTKSPHIVTIVVDDLGWGDVPWNNPESPAVNMGR